MIAALALALAVAAPAASRHVIVVGVNTSVDEGVAPLAYADDDAARFAEVLRDGAASLSVLSVLDQETQRVFPAVATLARPPTAAELERALDDAFRAMQSDRDADLVFIYVGHGAISDDGEGYVSLLDQRLTRTQMFERVLERSPARFNHIIVDACNAYHLLNRGKDAIQAVRSFLEEKSLARHPNTGLLLATSSAKETHEWARIRGGVFSHEVLSALSGAADVDSDGALAYPEIGAFIEAANAGVEDPRARVDFFLRPPPLFLARPLVTLRAPSTGVRFAAKDEGHFVVEDARGLTIAEINKNAEQPITVSLAGAAPYRVMRNGDVFTLREGVASFAKLPREDAEKVRARSSIANALEEGLFRVPFGKSWVAGYSARLAREEPTAEALEAGPNLWAVSTAVVAGTLVAGALVAGGIAALGVSDLENGKGRIDAFEATQIAERTNTALMTAALLGAGGVVVGAASSVLFFTGE